MGVETTEQSEELVELRAIARRVAGRVVGSSQDAEDVAQEAVARAIGSWERVSSYARPWIVRVATNLSIAKMCDRERVEVRAVPDSRLATSSVASELHLDLRTAVAALPVRQRQAVVLRYLADFSEAEVAELIGCSRGSVKRHLHRAVARLRESPTLTPLDTVTNEKENDVTIPTWTDEGWVPAAEPEAGWPSRPWDHWFVEGPEGSWDRVAVDADGQMILDGDGDEVMSGPGFDHQVVKVRPGTSMDPPDPRPAAPDSLSDLLDRAADHARFHGHPWVGDEHLALAACEAGAFGDRVTVDEFDQRIAEFYEGPFAADRVAIVRRRRSGQSFVHPPSASLSWTWGLGATLESVAAAAGESPTAEDVARLLMEKERSLVRRLLGGGFG